MKLLPKLLAATSIFAATAAIAGPPVTVTSPSTKPGVSCRALPIMTSSFFAHNRARYAGSKYEEGLS